MSDVVVITGASGGIGRATARRFAQDGAKIALLARGEAGLEATAREVEERGGKRLVLPPTSRTRPGRGRRTGAESELGPIDIWINDAMATIYGVPGRRAGRVRRATEVTYTAWSGGRAPR
jgi:NAD(P)-dependent dehydrogenase (short-subunit alcohol dehydrogenase family)